MTEIAFLTIPIVVICTEPGFEWKSRLLVRSLRAFGGRMKNASVVSYSPRAGQYPSNTCRDEFESLNVQMVVEPLNQEFTAYGLANKIFALNHAEVMLPGRSLLFLDSDKVILREPTAVLGLGRRTFAARPVDLRNCGAVSLDDCEGAFWQSIHRVCGVNHYRHVLTTLELERIVEYYNSGMIFAPTCIGLFSAWLRNFRRVWHECPRPVGGDFFVEQSTLAATVSALCDDVFILPETYNVPIHLRKDYPDRDWESALSKCVSLHYHGMFNRDVYRNKLSDLGTMLDSVRLAWLDSNLLELSQP